MCPNAKKQVFETGSRKLPSGNPQTIYNLCKAFLGLWSGTQIYLSQKKMSSNCGDVLKGISINLVVVPHLPKPSTSPLASKEQLQFPTKENAHGISTCTPKLDLSSSETRD